MKKHFLFLLSVVVTSLTASTLQAQNASPYWSLAGNANAATSSKLGTTNRVPVRLFTNNAERMRIDPFGKVGIGTAGPIGKLTILNNAGTPASSWVSGNPLFVGFGENAATNADHILSMASNILNAQPTFVLRKARGTLAAPSVVHNNDYLASMLASGYDGHGFQNPASIDFYVDGTPSTGNVPARISFATGTNSATRTERFKIGSTGDISFNSNQLYVQQSSGNVGIGTTSPGNKLDVEGGAGIGVYGNSTGSYGVFGRTSASYSYGVFGYNEGTDGYGVYGYSGYLGVYGYGGQVGVNGYGDTYGVSGTSGTAYGVYGTSSSSYNANGSAGIYGSAYYGVKGSGTYGIYGMGSTIGVYGNGTDAGVYGTGTLYGLSGYSASGVGVYGNSSNSSYGVYGNNSSDNGTGVYGKGGFIGVAGTGIKYGVYGVSLGGSNTYAGFFDGSIYVTNLYLGSDRKLKNNISDMTSAMDIINKLQPKTFEFKQDGNYKLMNLPKGSHYGLIAQDLEEVLPNLVKETSFDTRLAHLPDSVKVEQTSAKPFEVIDFKAVNYTELIPILVKAMQELNKKNNDQQNQIEVLKEIISKLAPGQINITADKGVLGQNTPNPGTTSTDIRYSIPQGLHKAQLVITDNLGRTIKAVQLTASGVVNINTASLSSGVYNYSLVVDEQIIDTKRMTVAK